MRYLKHLICDNQSVIEALVKLEELSTDAVLFLVDNKKSIIGSLTDGDIRRGLIKGLTLEDSLSSFIQPNPKVIRLDSWSINQIVGLREKNYLVIPIVDSDNKIVDIVNFRYQKSYLPIDAVLMAGGRGERLRPLTDKIPKPLLNIGGKPIIESNIDRIINYGISDFWISVHYMKDQFESYFKSGESKSISIKYVFEKKKLGTIGSLSLINDFKQDSILVMNSDLITNIDFEEFYKCFIENNADFAVACYPYQINIPYAVMETEGIKIINFKEKPTYTYYSNAGIYLLKKKLVEIIPKNKYYDATTFMFDLIKLGKKVISFPLIGYWKDIATNDDYVKANEDYKKIMF